MKGTATLDSIQHLNLHLTEDQKKLSTTKWQEAKQWVQWWIRPSHLRMLCKPFSLMSSSDWDSGPRNTNGVERANSLAKTSDRKISLYGAMQSLYEKDKMFALQYITATDGLKISYRSDVDQAQRSNSAFKRKAQQEAHKDIQCLFGPPDKRQHFDSAPRKESKKRKGKNIPADITSEGDKEVEV